MENVNILMGRFQPITVGHIKCAETAWKENGVKTILLVVETTKEDAKHPFATSMLLPTYKKLDKEFEFMAGVVVVKSADIVKNVEICRDNGFEPVSWSCGTDRIDAYQKMISKYGPQIGLTDDFKVIEIKRGDDDISATQVRNAILKDDKKTFEKLTPKTIHSLYSKLKVNVDKYCSIKEGKLSLKEFILERMGELSVEKMFKTYHSNISLHILKQGKKPVVVDKLMDAIDGCYNDTCISNNRIYWFFDDMNESDDVWIKFQRILSKKPIKDLTDRQVISDDSVELVYAVK